jgi:gamma-glutamylcyclotransferase (GGCT)/AIG2-like uncharacterized protein YtfP
MKGKLFVYGTLRSGGSAHRRILSRYEVEVATATLADHAIYGRTFRYPFMVREAGGTVVGDLVTYPIAVEDELLSRLDRYEGEEYVRAGAMVAPASGDSVDAWVYLAFPDMAFDPAERIDSGDWFERG